MSNKYKGRWDRLFKVKLNFPEHLNDDDVNTRITNELIGDQINNDDIDGKTKHANDVQDMIENLNNEKNEIPKIVLMLRNEEDEHGSKPQNLDFFKFLSDANGNFE